MTELYHKPRHDPCHAHKLINISKLFSFKAPATPSSYIANLIEPIRTFKINHAKIVSEEQIMEWSLAISESVSEKYVVYTFIQRPRTKVLDPLAPYN